MGHHRSRPTAPTSVPLMFVFCLLSEDVNHNSNEQQPRRTGRGITKLHGDGIRRIAGDLNAKHLLRNSRSANPAGQTLYSLIQQANYSVIALIISYHFSGHPGHRSDVLYIASTNLLHYYIETVYLNELSSDHILYF